MRGNARENQVASFLRDEGWIVGSLRHTRGGGDLIAARYLDADCAEVRLIEVKATAGGPYERFGPKDRAEMLTAAEDAGGTAWLVHWPAHGPQRWIASEDWPR